MNLQHAPAVIPMIEPFDPYRKWLGIPPKDQPPHHYRLLGIALFENDPDVIENAATRQMAHVRTYQSGRHSADSQRILNELTAAKLALLRAEKKAAYDEQLRAKLGAAGKLSSDHLLVAAARPEPPLAQEEPTGEELPERRLPSNRWKTEAEDSSSAEPPIVPIPMPVGVSIAAPPRISPSLPLAPAPLMVSGLSRTSYRRKKSASSAIPIAIAILSVMLVFAGGITAVVVSGVLSPPAERHSKKIPVSSVKTKSHADEEVPLPKPEHRKPKSEHKS